MSRRYAIKSVDEARAYLAHPVLGKRLLEKYFEGERDGKTLEMIGSA